MEAPCRFNVFVGSETGFIKGVNTHKSEFSNLNPVTKVGNGVDRNEEITSMCWGDEDNKTIYVGLRNQTVKTFSVDKDAIILSTEVIGGEGPLKGIGIYNRNLLTCSESGFVKYWSKNEQVVIEAGDDIWKMKQNQECPQRFATGGKENDLKVWDLQTPDAPIFAAKNVRNDFLDLRVPVWICDMQFVPESERIITATGHNQVRLYDPKARQRRPVINVEIDEYPLLSLSLAPQENQVVVGNSRGRVLLVDLRKGAMVHAFKGFAGSVRCVQCHPTLPLVASCGLDRHLRIHNLNDKKMISKIYLKSRLNCLLLCSNFNSCLPEDKDGSVEEEKASAESEELWEHIEVASDDEDDSTRQTELKPKGRKKTGKLRKKRKHSDEEHDT